PPKIDKGVVTEWRFVTDNMTDISPVRTLAGLKVLVCSGSKSSKLSDLTPLRGMPLTFLDCSQTHVSDLTPLAGMPLTYLICLSTQVSNLSPLRDCQGLARLRIAYTPLSD